MLKKTETEHIASVTLTETTFGIAAEQKQAAQEAGKKQQKKPHQNTTFYKICQQDRKPKSILENTKIFHKTQRQINNNKQNISPNTFS